MPTRQPYPTDLTDAEWDCIRAFFSVRPKGLVGRPREIAYRDIVDAILYLVRTGCQWRNLPHDFPCYSTVSDYYHLWRKNGLLERIHAALRHKVRQQAGKEPEPSVVLRDSQSVKTTEKGGRKSLTRLSVLTWANSSRGVNATSP